MASVSLGVSPRVRFAQPKKVQRYRNKEYKVEYVGGNQMRRIEESIKQERSTER